MDASRVDAWPYGGWVRMTVADPENLSRLAVAGELIAVQDDSVFVLTRRVLMAYDSDLVVRADLFGYLSEHNKLALWSVGGTLSTLSHGVGLIISGPMWIIIGTAATSGRSRTPRIKYPGRPLDEFRVYARYPQGLSGDLDRSRIAPRK